MPKKLTKKERLQREYDKQIRRISKRLEQLENQGYNVGYVESKVEVKPKRITDATIRRLKAITPKFIRSHSSYEDYHTGELVQPKSKAARQYLINFEKWDTEQSTGEYGWIGDFSSTPSLPQASRMDEYEENIYSGDDAGQLILDNFYSELDGFPQSWAQEAHRLFDNAVNQYGIQHVAEALQNMPESFHFFVQTHKYPSDDYLEAFYNEFLEYLNLDKKTYYQIESDADNIQYD